MRFMVEYIYVSRTEDEAIKRSTRCFMDLAIFTTESAVAAAETAELTAPLVLAAHCRRYLDREPILAEDDWEVSVQAFYQWGDEREKNADVILRRALAQGIKAPADLSEHAREPKTTYNPRLQPLPHDTFPEFAEHGIYRED